LTSQQSMFLLLSFVLHTFLFVLLVSVTQFVFVIWAFFITKNRQFPSLDIIYDNDFFRLGNFF